MSIRHSLPVLVLALSGWSAAQPPAEPPKSTGSDPAIPADAPAAAPTPSPSALTTPLAHVETRGTGPIPIILIPGLVCDWTTFDAFMDRNAARYTMYAVTLPGFGGSEPPPMPTSNTYHQGEWLDNAARAVAALIAERNLDKPVLLGQTMGTQVALRVAAAKPDTVRAVIAVNGWPAYPLGGAEQAIDRSNRENLINGLMHSTCDAIAESEWMNQQKEWIELGVDDKARAAAIVAVGAKVTKPVSTRYMLEYLAADLSELAPKATMPVLVIAALQNVEFAEDDAALRSMWEREWKPVPQHTLVFFEDTAEFVTENAPADLDRAVEQFLANRPVEGRKGTPKPPRPTTPQPAAPDQPQASEPAPPAAAPTAPGKPGATDPVPPDPGAEPKPAGPPR